MNDMTDQPAWATDPRGLPPALKDRGGYVWPLHEDGVHYEGSTIKDVVTHRGPVTPLWPDTPPTSPLPDLSRWHPVPVGATIPAGARFVIIWGDDDDFSSYVADPPGVTQRLGDDPRYAEHPIPAPDPDAKWVAELVNTRANPLSEADARALIAAIREARR